MRCVGQVVGGGESKGRGQSLEIQADSIEVLGLVEDPDTYPIQPKQHSFEFLRTVAHLRPAHQYLWCRDPRSSRGRPCSPRVF